MISEMLRKFLGQSRQADLTVLIARLEACDIKLKSPEKINYLRNELTDSFSGSMELLLCVMGTVPFDEESFEDLEALSDDIWHFDYEAIEDHGAYTQIVANCARISGDELKLKSIKDYVDIEEGTAWVEWNVGTKKSRVDLEVDNDWTDPNIFVTLNELLAEQGSLKKIAQHDLGQDCLLVCKHPQQISQIESVTGLKFRILSR